MNSKLIVIESKRGPKKGSHLYSKSTKGGAQWDLKGLAFG